MPNSGIIFGPFAAVYVGNSDSVTALTRLTPIRTKGSRFLYEVPQQYEPLLGKPIQSGPAQLSFELTFYGTDASIMRLAMGNSVEPSALPAEDAPSTFQTYTILLLHRSTASSQSILIPNCWTAKKVALNHQKTAPTEMTITFEATNPNRFVKLFHKGTLSTLKAVPTYGSRIPIS